MIASMMRSHSFMPMNAVVPERLPSVVSRASPVTLPFATPSSRNFLIRPSPLLRATSSTSRTIVLYPAAAHTCAMPDPIRPHPNTPTVCISMISPPRVRRPALPERQAEAFATCRCTFKTSHYERHEITQRDHFSLFVCFVRFVGFVCVFRVFRVLVLLCQG